MSWEERNLVLESGLTVGSLVLGGSVWGDPSALFCWLSLPHKLSVFLPAVRGSSVTLVDFPVVTVTFPMGGAGGMVAGMAGCP